MSDLSREQLSNSTLPKPEPANRNLFGDVVCPFCGINLMTPAGYEVRAGDATCPRCGGLLTVSQSLADEANRIAARRRSNGSIAVALGYPMCPSCGMDLTLRTRVFTDKGWVKCARCCYGLAPVDRIAPEADGQSCGETAHD
jgi:Zn-finger nucleic acid-binding protein